MKTKLAEAISLAERSQTVVPPPNLPDLFLGLAKPVSVNSWRTKCRPKIIEMFSDNVYGHFPKGSFRMSDEAVEASSWSLNCKTFLRQMKLRVETDAGSHSMDLLLFLPKLANEPVPVFLGLNFHGNHTVHPAPQIHLPQSWVRNTHITGATQNQAIAGSRGCMARRWPVDRIIDQGCGLATIYCGDIAPDNAYQWQNGIVRLFRDPEQPRCAKEWGAVAAWAWGLQRGLDSLRKDPSVDPAAITVFGHSRLGKAALWAGATDERFAAVISNNSGCAGASLARRKIGETVQKINATFPHWFCPAYQTFGDAEERLPVDQHMLIALFAPRPAYIASASEDDWADPVGEFLATRLATPAYEIFGHMGLATETMPPCSLSIGKRIAYHIRSGQHDLLEEDWGYFLQFIKKHHPKRVV